MLKDKGIEVPINVELGEDKTSVIYSHIGKKKLKWKIQWIYLLNIVKNQYIS